MTIAPTLSPSQLLVPLEAESWHRVIHDPLLRACVYLRAGTCVRTASCRLWLRTRDLRRGATFVPISATLSLRLRLERATYVGTHGT